MASPEKKQELAADLWRSISDVVLERQAQSAAAFGKLGLTPGHIRAMLVLDDEPRPMRWLAERFTVDPSTVTWIVDRLEQRGLVVRQPLSSDRRVKAIVLTPRGQQTKVRLEAMLYEPPVELVDLPATTLARLRQAFAAMGSASDLGEDHAEGAVAEG